MACAAPRCKIVGDSAPPGSSAFPNDVGAYCRCDRWARAKAMTDEELISLVQAFCLAIQSYDESLRRDREFDVELNGRRHSIPQFCDLVSQKYGHLTMPDGLYVWLCELTSSLGTPTDRSFGAGSECLQRLYDRFIA
jgi:hypothetical protein